MNARLVFAAVGFAWFAACVSAITLDEFAEPTQRVIASGSFDGFQPTVIYPARRHIKGFDSFPPDLPDAESRILRWAAEGTAKDEEFLVAFKIDQKHFKIIRCVGAQQTGSKTYAVR
jgi:hypothetical protein